MSKPTALDEMKKAQNILLEAVDKSTRTHLEAVEKLLEFNKQRFSNLSEANNPGEYVARQSEAFKEYAEHCTAHVKALTAIGNESREQLTELSQEFAKNLDFSSFFPFADTGTEKAKSKSGGKST
ncbi:MAG: hypothetical protein GVY11_00480 [Gammaproteobacteria bacterium]|jgi:4-alpha-glucanotransferase|nr:hypothetical protein [Gammaproteobacteria bacterium]